MATETLWSSSSFKNLKTDSVGFPAISRDIKAKLARLRSDQPLENRDF